MNPRTLGALVLMLGCSDRTLVDDDGETEGEAEDVGNESTGDPPPDMLSDIHKDESALVPEELQFIADGAVAWFATADPPRCPHPAGSPMGGDAGTTPGVGYGCQLGPNGQCVPVPGGGSAFEYDPSDWTDNPVWTAIGFEKTTPHAFHYNFVAENDLRGTCTYRAEAFGDFDGDVLFATYSLSGVVDLRGDMREAIMISGDPDDLPKP